jgi:agmatinase
METFLGLAKVDIADVQAGSIVLFAAPEATPYEAGKTSHASGAPWALRMASERYAGWHTHHDFDTGEPLIPPAANIVDAGDVPGDPKTPAENRAAIEAATKSVLAAGAAPLVIGGDDSVPIPVMSAYRDHGPIWVVQIDAHIDWRDERFGEKLGWSSPMRRASEMNWVEGIVQLGARGVGSARPEEVAEASAWGATIVTAREIHHQGVASALAAIPAGARVFITLDLDGLDPAIMPAVAARVPGGLTYWHVIDIFDGLAAAHQIVGCDIVELAPDRDVDGLGALTGVRLIATAAAAMARSIR